MDNVFANKTLTPELLEGYFDSMEQAVDQLEKSVPKAPPGNGNIFAERRLVSLWSTEKPGSPVAEARIRPDWRTLMSRADAVPYKLEEVKVLPDTGRIEELSGVSRLASYAQRPGWVSRTGHTYPGSALELHLDLEGATPINALDSGIDQDTGMRLVELWYVGGDWSEKGDSRGLRSIPVKTSDRIQLFAPVLARKLILVLANQTGAYEAPPQGEVKARRIALEVGQAQDDEPQVASGAWQYLLDAEQPRLYTVEGPLQLETTLAQIDSPTLQLECEVEEISEAGNLLDLGNSTRHLQWKDYAGGTEAFNLVLDPRRLWTRTGNPLEGLGLPLTAGTYHLCLSGAAAGGWTTQQGPSGTLAIWSKLLWMWWDDGEEHDGLTTDREVKGDADIFNASDPAGADEFVSFTLKRDTTVWFYLPAAREPAHSFPIHAVLTSDNQRSTTATYRPGEWVELPVDTYYSAVRSVPSRGVSSTNNTEQAVDSVFLDLSSCGQPSRAWVYVREDGRWHFVQELIVADQQRFQVPINRARVTRLRLFFPPTPAAMPSWQSSGDVYPQRILVQEPSFLEIGSEVKPGALITGRQPWRRGMYVLSFEDPSQLTQANDPNWPGSLLHARNFQLCPYRGPMTVEKLHCKK